MQVFNHLKKYPAIAMTLFAMTGSSIAVADYQGSDSTNDAPEKSTTGFYFGGFGGWGASNPIHIAQKGIAFYLSPQGGPLVVDSSGHAHKKSGYGFGGIHFGYEWLPEYKRKFHVTPGAEIEGYYFAQTKRVTLVNPTERLDFHQFKDKFPMREGIVLANFTLALTNDYLTPYIGIGLGASIVKIQRAQGIQTQFPEPGINHFNSNPNAFNWSFATQFKTGLRYSPWKHMRFFAEYRFLYQSAVNYTFGHTVYPGHVATGDWDVRFGGICNNMVSLGIDFPI